MIALDEEAAHESTLASLAVDLAPLLDTFFILLVFFMLTTGDVVQSLTIELPAAASQDDTVPAEDRGRILLEIGESGYALDGAPVADFNALAAAVAERAPLIEEDGLVIASDRRATVETLMKVLTHLQSEGLEVADLLMRHETEDR